MTDLWIVTSGEYSSYSVVAGFTTMDAADAYAAVCNANHTFIDYRVERIDVDPPLPERVRQVVADSYAFESLPALETVEQRRREQETLINSLDIPF